MYARTNEALEPITLVLAYPTVYVHIYRMVLNYIQHNHQYHIPLLKLSQPVPINIISHLLCQE